MPKPFASSAAADATVGRVAPAVPAPLADGAPRGRRAIVAALADRHPQGEVVGTRLRPAVTGRVAEANRRYAPAAEKDAGVARPAAVHGSPVDVPGGPPCAAAHADGDVGHGQGDARPRRDTADGGGTAATGRAAGPLLDVVGWWRAIRPWETAQAVR